MSVPARSVTIYVTKVPEARVRAAVTADTTFGHVQFKIVRYTMARLIAGQSLVAARLGKFRQAGIGITDWGPDPVTNSLHVGLLHPTKAAEAAVRAAVGIPVTFTSEKSYPQAATTRLGDVPGFNGGDFMATAGGLGCTTGVPVLNSAGGQYILSVSHCFNNTDHVSVYNDDINDSKSCNFTGCVTLGESSHHDDSAGFDDALMSGPNYSDLDWGNNTPYNPPGTLNGFTTMQGSDSVSVVGELVCPSGAYEGMVCNTTVGYVKEDANIPDLPGTPIHNMDRAQNTTTIPVGGGDSGGPVFTRPSGHLNIEGIIDARGNPIACKTYTIRGDDCSYTIYYIDFGAQAARFGVGLKIS